MSFKSMKLLDDLKLESFKNPFLYSVIGSYVLNNFPLIVGFIFNVSSNPIGESQVLIQEKEFSFCYFLIFFLAQTIGKPSIALLISIIKSTFARLEKEILSGKKFFTYRFKYTKLKEEYKKNLDSLNDSDKIKNDILLSFIIYLNNQNRGTLHSLVKYEKELPIKKFIYFNRNTKQVETSDDEIIKASYCLGFCANKIDSYYIMIYESRFLDDDILNKFNLLPEYTRKNYNFFTFYKGMIQASHLSDSNCSFYHRTDGKFNKIGVSIPQINRDLFYQSPIFDLDESIKTESTFDAIKDIEEDED